jgi:hypothetical protein
MDDASTLFLRASMITEFRPNPAYDYQSKPF